MTRSAVRAVPGTLRTARSPDAARGTDRDLDRGARPAGERLAYLDNLKTLLIAGIIAAHAIQGYSEFGSWTYQDVQEVTLSPIVETVFVVAMVSLGALFLMALFFLVSGLFTEDSLARKGSSRFVSERLLRLGVPFAIYTLLVWPLLEFALLEPYLHRGFWRSVADTDPVLDNGPMWFVGVLLLFSLGAGRLAEAVPAAGRSRGGTLRWRDLVLLSAAVGVATFLVRIVLPADSNQPLNIKLWAWPEYLALFGLGVVAARRGWLRPVPDALARRCGIATLVGIACVAAAVLSAEPLGLTEDAYFGGWRLTALRRGDGRGRARGLRVDLGVGVRAAAPRSHRAAAPGDGPELLRWRSCCRGRCSSPSRSLLRPADLSGDVKALLVATLGIVGSFALAWPVVTRTPLRRML